MHHCSNYQMEFSNLPERNGPAPLQNAQELHEVLTALLDTQNEHQRVATCQKLIDSAYAGHLFCVLPDPMRIEAREPGMTRSSRAVLLSSDSIIGIILTALASASAHHNAHGHRHRMCGELIIH